MFDTVLHEVVAWTNDTLLSLEQWEYATVILLSKYQSFPEYAWGCTVYNVLTVFRLQYVIIRSGYKPNMFIFQAKCCISKYW